MAARRWRRPLQPHPRPASEKGWTLEEMWSHCDVSRSMLSEIERGRANPTLAVAYRIAQAFGLSLDELIELPTVTHRLDVIRRTTNSYFRSDRYCRIRTLSPLHLEKAVEFYEIVLHKGGGLKSEPHFEGARNCLPCSRARFASARRKSPSNWAPAIRPIIRRHRARDRERWRRRRGVVPRGYVFVKFVGGTNSLQASAGPPC